MMLQIELITYHSLEYLHPKEDFEQGGRGLVIKWFDLIWFDSGIRWTLALHPSIPKNKEKRGIKETKIEIEKSKVHQTNSTEPSA